MGVPGLRSNPGAGLRRRVASRGSRPGPSLDVPLPSHATRPAGSRPPPGQRASRAPEITPPEAECATPPCRYGRDARIYRATRGCTVIPCTLTVSGEESKPMTSKRKAVKEHALWEHTTREWATESPAAWRWTCTTAGRHGPPLRRRRRARPGETVWSEVPVRFNQRLASPRAGRRQPMPVIRPWLVTSGRVVGRLADGLTVRVPLGEDGRSRVDLSYRQGDPRRRRRRGAAAPVERAGPGPYGRSRRVPPLRARRPDRPPRARHTPRAGGDCPRAPPPRSIGQANLPSPKQSRSECPARDGTRWRTRRDRPTGGRLSGPEEVPARPGPPPLAGPRRPRQRTRRRLRGPAARRHRPPRHPPEPVAALRKYIAAHAMTGTDRGKTITVNITTAQDDWLRSPRIAPAPRHHPAPTHPRPHRLASRQPRRPRPL